MRLSATLGSLLLCTALAETPLDCFEQGKRLYGSQSSLEVKTDLDLIETLSKDHVLTKIEACEFPNGRVSSVQVTYGIWS